MDSPLPPARSLLLSPALFTQTQAYAHHASGLRVPVDLVVTMLSNDYPEFIDFPKRQTARIGFELTADIKAFQNSAASGLYVGFTVGRLPSGLHLSTVRGKGINRQSDPAIMTLRWTPCQKDLGSHVLCIDAVNNLGRAATQKCLVIDVVKDDVPTLTITELHTSTVIDDKKTTSDLMMGVEYSFNISAHDANKLDTLEVMAVDVSEEGVIVNDDCQQDECIPPSAVLSSTVHVQGITGTTSWRQLTFAPKHNHGGYKMQHCFAVRDSCGRSCDDDECPGHRDVVKKCITFKVKRCMMVVRKGQQLQQIAAIYHSDWLQMWSHNHDILHPDILDLPDDTVLPCKPSFSNTDLEACHCDHLVFCMELVEVLT
jgi:hypothetical protein